MVEMNITYFSAYWKWTTVLAWVQFLSNIMKINLENICSLGPNIGNFHCKPHSNFWFTIGLAFGIFHQLAYTLKTGKYSDFCASNQYIIS